MNIKIETERFYLREFIPSDENGIFELDSNPAVHTYLGNNPITKIEDVRKYIEFLNKQYKENGIGRWAVIDKFTEEFIGWSGIKLIKEPMNNHNNFYELGYRFKRKHWGKGFATESSNAILDYGFKKLNTDIIFAITDPKNENSKKVLTKLGFDFKETFDYEGDPTDWFELKKTTLENKKPNR